MSTLVFFRIFIYIQTSYLKFINDILITKSKKCNKKEKNCQKSVLTTLTKSNHLCKIYGYSCV